MDFKNIESFLHEFKKRESTCNRILEWKKLAEEEPDDIKRFMFRWISFNGLYTAFYAMKYNQEVAESEREWKVILFFCDTFILTDKNLALKIYSEEIKEGLLKVIKRKERYMGSYLEKLEICQKIEEKAKFMVMVAYKIRCRLFHGEKNPILDVNKEVINMADDIISPVLNYILDERK